MGIESVGENLNVKYHINNPDIHILKEDIFDGYPSVQFCYKGVNFPLPIRSDKDINLRINNALTSFTQNWARAELGKIQKPSIPLVRSYDTYNDVYYTPMPGGQKRKSEGIYVDDHIGKGDTLIVESEDLHDLITAGDSGFIDALYRSGKLQQNDIGSQTFAAATADFFQQISKKINTEQHFSVRSH